MAINFKIKIVKRRQLSFIATFIILIAAYFVFKDNGWQGSKHLHTSMEIIASLLSFGAGLLALVRFYTKKSNTFLFIGAAFIGTGLLDGYHTIVTAEFFDQLFPSPPENLIPWSWNASRFFLAITMFGSYVSWKIEFHPIRPRTFKEENIYLIIGLFTLVSFLLFAIVPLPRAYYPELFFGRPEEFVAALFFLMALIGYYKKRWWQSSDFDYWVILSLIVGFVSQVLYMPLSFKLFDFQFDAAHLLKKLSYLCVHTGLLISFYYLFNKSEKQKIQILAEIKERELAEKNMAKYRGQNQLILNSAVEGIIGLDKMGRHTFVNPAALQILGYTEDEMLGEEGHSLWHHSYEDRTDYNKEDCIILKALQEEFSQVSDNDVFWHKDGTAIHVQFTVSPLKQREKSIGLMIVFQDVTKIRHSEAELQKSRDLIDSFLDNSTAVIYIKDVQGKYILVNKMYEKLFRIKQSEVIGKTDFDIFSKEMAEVFKKSDLKIINSKEQLKLEELVPQEDGIHTYLSSKFPLIDQNGKVYAVGGVATDISEEKLLQEKLWYSENLIRMILDQIPQRIFWKDKDYKFLGANKLFVSDTGFSSSEELIGRDDFEMPWKKHAHLYREDDRLVLEDGNTKINLEETIIDLKGNEQWIRTSKQPLLDQNGNVFGVLGNFENITARKKAETDLKNYAHALEKSNKELEDFAYIASHDLQEPLRKVITFGNRLKEKYEEDLPEKAQDYLKRMSNAANRMRTLINDLLDFSRVTSRAKEFEEVDLNKILKEVLRNLEIKIEEENALIDLEKLHSIEADSSQTYRLFQNIINNSLQYRKKDINLKIKIHSKIANRDGLEIKKNLHPAYCHIYVEDNGTGFNEKYLDKIFAPFQRLHGRQEYQGTGMGLAICSKIVSRHNGLISAKSRIGEGSTFIISLPVQQTKKEGIL